MVSNLGQMHEMEVVLADTGGLSVRRIHEDDKSQGIEKSDIGASFRTPEHVEALVREQLIVNRVGM